MDIGKRKTASKELIVNTIIFGVGIFSSKIIMFLLLPVYTSYMSTKELGEGELVVNFMNLLYPIVTLNILSALLRYSMDKEKDKKKVLQSTYFIVIIGMLVLGIFFSITKIKSSINNWKLYIWILLFCYTFQEILSVFSKAIDNTKAFTIGKIIYTFSLLIISSILLIVFKRKTYGYLEGMIFSNIIVCVFYASYLKINKYITYEKLDFSLIKEMVIFSFPLIINSISWWITSFCDRFVLEMNLGTNAVGIYSVSSKIPTIVSTISSIFMQAWTLSAIKAYQEKDNNFLNTVFKKFESLFVIWASLIIVTSQIITSIFVGKEFIESWLYVPLLICSTVFNSLGSFYAVIYTAAKKNFSVMITTLVGALVNILLNFILIPKFGIQGAVVATMISQLIITVFRIFDSRKIVKIDKNFNKMIVSSILLILESILLIKLKNNLLTISFCIIIVTIHFEDIKDISYSLYKKLKGVKNNEKNFKNRKK